MLMRWNVVMQYISLLRKNQMKSRVRSARQAMQTIFPLSQELWLEWLDDELTAKADDAFLDSLFKLAVEDYLSIAIWERYLRSATYLFKDVISHPLAASLDAIHLPMVCNGVGGLSYSSLVDAICVYEHEKVRHLICLVS